MEKIRTLKQIKLAKDKIERVEKALSSVATVGGGVVICNRSNYIKAVKILENNNYEFIGRDNGGVFKNYAFNTTFTIKLAV